MSKLMRVACQSKSVPCDIVPQAFRTFLCLAFPVFGLTPITRGSVRYRRSAAPSAQIQQRLREVLVSWGYGKFFGG